tara:strand:+ start:321 stop:554 length:234 start_codon:yes stop_codon:yes gene_type:complete
MQVEIFNMGSKDDALAELEALIKEYDLAPSTVGREVVGDSKLMYRMRDPSVSVTTATLDRIARYVMNKRGQLEMELE